MRKLCILCCCFILMSIVGCASQGDITKNSSVDKDLMYEAKSQLITDKDTESISSSKSENLVSSYNNNTAPNRAPEWLGETFRYDAETCPSTDLLIEWIKSEGTMVVEGKRYSDYPWHTELFEAIKNKETLIIPKPRNGAKFRYSSAFASWPGFNVQIAVSGIYTKDVWLEVCVSMNSPIFKNNNIKKYHYIKSDVTCPWGEYYYKNAEDEMEVPRAVFKYDEEYTIEVVAYGATRGGNWSHEFFDYFDFETVSLKD